MRAKLSWRGVSVLVVTCALAFAVATRYTDYSSIGTHSHASVYQPNHSTTRQHLDNSSFNWTFALSSCPYIELPPALPQVTLSNLPPLKILYGDDLYNRPPPAA